MTAEKERSRTNRATGDHQKKRWCKTFRASREIQTGNRTLCEPTQGRNAHQHVTKPIAYGRSKKERRSPGPPPILCSRCVIEVHINMAQKTFYREICSNNAATWNRGARFARACVVEMRIKMNQKLFATEIWRNPKPPPTLCTSLRGRNAHQHETIAIYVDMYLQKGRGRVGAPSSKSGLYDCHTERWVWTLCLQQNVSENRSAFPPVTRRNQLRHTKATRSLGLKSIPSVRSFLNIRFISSRVSTFSAENGHRKKINARICGEYDPCVSTIMFYRLCESPGKGMHSFWNLSIPFSASRFFTLVFLSKTGTWRKQQLVRRTQFDSFDNGVHSGLWLGTIVWNIFSVVEDSLWE